MKILIGAIILSFTGLAYLYPKPFPENYNMICVSLVGYAFFSLIYVYLERYMIKNIFYSGLGKNCKDDITEIRFSSEVKDHCNIYYFWIETTTNDSKKSYTLEKIEEPYNKYFDDRGYILKDEVINFFVKDKLKNLVDKKTK